MDFSSILYTDENSSQDTALYRFLCTCLIDRLESGKRNTVSVYMLEFLVRLRRWLLCIRRTVDVVEDVVEWDNPVFDDIEN
jgi:hypothetical protein